MFKEVTSQVKFTALEAEILRFWQEHDIFNRSVKQREGCPKYVFYEGPPTANGHPHIGHVLTRAFKDIYPRYKTMKGFHSTRKAGWDTHGLPVEIEVERDLGFSGKQAIEEYGVANFNQRCRESVFRYVDEWNELTYRMGFWLDLGDPYVTLHNSYVESVWWIIRQMWDNGHIYKDYKVVPYCARCGTSLSSHEVSLGYEEVEDPAIHIKFRLLAPQLPGLPEGADAYALVWTTTPWTLPGNVALAINPELEYVLVHAPASYEGGEPQYLVLARQLVEQTIRGDYEVISTVPASALVGVSYEPLYRFSSPEKRAWYIVGGEFVTAEEGTGIVHMAPAYGEDDMVMARRYDLPVLEMVDPHGAFVDEVEPWRGQWVKEADPRIIRELRERGLLYRAARHKHTYPFCWRCDTPLLYYAKTSWFARRTAVRDSLIRNNQQINWYPEHIKDGRFGGFLDGIIDWALSRERYWGTPLPIWECADCGKRHCIGSLSELQEMAVTPVADDLDLHRPFVDDVLLNCPQCGGEMKRVPEVIDAWFDSGSMPVAQWHYPFENHDLFAEQFPADYICEAIDQTRGWFLSLHVISTMLFDQISYRNCVCLEHVLDGKGEKMSKHKGNVVAPNTVLDVQGADALRWYMLTSSPPGTPRRFSAELVDEALRKFMLTLWNTYSFFVTYANIDNWQPAANGNALEPVRQDLSEMDRWILSELQVLITEVTEMLDHYDATGAGRAIEEFVDRLSNWYVRRSRRRFWKSESDRDKAAAYATLYECLVKLAQLLAPFTPFLTESMWQNLVCSPRPEAPDSVHLSDFPTPDATLIDQPLLEAMRLAARLVSMGRAARNKASIKVKQPLSEVIFRLDETRRENIRPLLPVILDELNVKAVRFTDDPAELVSYSLKGKLGALGPKLGRDMQAVLKALDAVDPQLVMKAKRSGQPIEIAGFQIDAADIEIVRTELPELSVVDEGDLLVGICTTLTEEQLDEGLARELVRAVQATRKAAGYQITDRIRIYLGEDETLGRVVERFSEYIRQETLADELQLASAPAAAHKSSAKLSGGTVQIAVERVAT